VPTTRSGSFGVAAGRSLPEYRRLREGISLSSISCTPAELITEITLQPPLAPVLPWTAGSILFSDNRVPLSRWGGPVGHPTWISRPRDRAGCRDPGVATPHTRWDLGAACAPLDRWGPGDVPYVNRRPVPGRSVVPRWTIARLIGFRPEAPSRASPPTWWKAGPVQENPNGQDQGAVYGDRRWLAPPCSAVWPPPPSSFLRKIQGGCPGAQIRPPPNPASRLVGGRVHSRTDLPARDPCRTTSPDLRPRLRVAGVPRHHFWGGGNGNCSGCGGGRRRRGRVDWRSSPPRNEAVRRWSRARPAAGGKPRPAVRCASRRGKVIEERKPGTCLNSAAAPPRARCSTRPRRGAARKPIRTWAGQAWPNKRPSVTPKFGFTRPP